MTKSSAFLLYVLLLTTVFAVSCEKAPVETDGCYFDARNACQGFSFSIVNKGTYENLIGEDRLIHPDSIVITNTRSDVMHHRPYSYSDGWYTIEEFSPFQEMYCFNQCKLDSSFTRTYYLYVGNGDTDTLEVFYQSRSEREDTFYNGVSGGEYGYTPTEIEGPKSPYYFRKKVN